jgi:transposase-like protein
MKNKNIIQQSDNDLNKFKQQLLEGIKAGKPLSGKDGLLTPLLKEVIEASLEGELDAYLQEEDSNNINNRRNGYTNKEIRSESGTFQLSTPRDRNSSFEPQIVKKRQTILNDTMDQKILSLFSSGMGYTEISNHIADMYDVDVSTSTISAITDRLIPKITEWRARPLDSIYPVVFLDGMYFKVRDGGKVVTKVLYNILGINQAGIKEILGFYIAESEGANFWLGVLNDLRERGVKDVLIACIDGLTGFPQAIATIFPKTEVQLCVVHQIRSSLKYVVSKEQKQFLADLKLVYTAANKDLAETNLNMLDEKWGKRYPSVIKSWINNWENLSQYFKYSSEIRRLIYTTNPIEGFHRQVRKFTKTKSAFVSENALFKLMYCACQKIQKKWTAPMANWGLIISQLDLHFEDRINLCEKTNI